MTELIGLDGLADVGVELPDGPYPGTDDAVAGATGLPRLRVDLVDGASHTVQVTLADVIAYEDMAGRLRWPVLPNKAPTRWAAYTAWNALRRTGILDDPATPAAFDAFTQRVAQLLPAGAVGPTGPAPGPG